MRVGRAIEKVPSLSADVDAFTRTIVQGESVLLLQANAAESGFDVTSPQLSQRMLDAAESAWRRGVGLGNLFSAASQPLATSRAGEEGAAGGLTAVLVEGPSITVLWAGGLEAWLVGETGVVARAEGHTLARQLGSPDAPKLLVRGLGDGYAATSPEELVWTAAPGQRLVVLGGAVLHALPEAEIVRRTMLGDAADAAKMLVQATVGAGGPYAAVIVAEVGGVEG